MEVRPWFFVGRFVHEAVPYHGVLLWRLLVGFCRRTVLITWHRARDRYDLVCDGYIVRFGR